MAAAVHRSADEREAWHPEQAITPREALAASTDGWGTVAPGHPADLVLLDTDPLAPTADPAEAAARLRSMNVAVTWVAGRPVESGQCPTLAPAAPSPSSATPTRASPR
jgi:cytosine/adenosine deaminase-related metal-dependent hydrolase